MAKAKQTKQTKQTQPVAQFAAMFGALAWGFIEAAAASASRSADAVRIIGEMFATLKGDAYAAEVARLFGNGEKGKAHEPGVVKAELESRAKAEGRDVPPSARAFLHQCRTVALSYSAPAVREAAEKSGIRAGYDAAKPKAEGETKGKAKAEPVALTFAEIVMSEIERVGLPAVLGIVESAMTARKDTIRASIVHDARIAASK